MASLRIVLIVAGLTAACGGQLEMPDSDADSGSADASVAEVSPPAGYYDEVVAEEFASLLGRAEPDLERGEVLFLNLNGATVTQDDSFLICESSARIPAANLEGEKRQQFVDVVTRYLQSYSSSIEVTETRPLRGAYTTLHVGGTYKSLGCGEADLKYQIARDVEGIHPSDVGFVFSEATDDLDDLVTQAQTAAEGLMGLSANSAGLVTTAVTMTSELSGIDELHAMSRLLWRLDDSEVVDISPLMPELRRTIVGDESYLSGFDKIVTIVLGVAGEQDGESAGNGGGGSTGNNNNKNCLFPRLCNALGGGTTSSPLTNVAGSAAGAGAGAGGGAADLLSTMASLANQPQIAAVAGILGPLMQGAGGAGGSSSGSSSDNSVQLPDFASVINMRAHGSLSDLLADLRGHALYVSEEYQGDTKQALESLLFVAYSQAYRDYMGEEEVAAVESDTN